MLDKRSIMRDLRIAHMGLSRRIRLRFRSTVATSVASVDPLSDAAPAPSTDTFKYITGQFNELKDTQDYEQTGVVQAQRGVVYIHQMYMSEMQGAYSLYIGGTGKEWNKVSSVTYDDSRCSLKVIVEASQ
jgi:hypothetical protein